MRPRRYLTSKPTTKTVALDSATLSTLELIAPGSLSEAVRFCVQFAIQHGAVKAAAAAHTPAQAQLYLHAVSPNAPLPTTYGGHVMTVRPAPTPEPAQGATPAPTQPATVWTQPEPIQPQRAHPSEARPGTLEEYLMYADDDDDDDTPAQVALQPVATQEPTVIRGQPLSAAALAAVAAIALTDDEIRALDPARGGAQPFVG